MKRPPQLGAAARAQLGETRFGSLASAPRSSVGSRPTFPATPSGRNPGLPPTPTSTSRGQKTNADEQTGSSTRPVRGSRNSDEDLQLLLSKDDAAPLIQARIKKMMEDMPTGVASESSTSFCARYEKGKACAQALDYILKHPPPPKSLKNELRKDQLTEMKDSLSKRDRLRARIGFIVLSPYFDYIMGLVILVNCASIGIEQTLVLEGRSIASVEILEHFFLCAYLIEFLMHMVNEPEELLTSRWLQFDFILVVMGIVTSWFLTPMLGTLDGLGPLMVLRMVRLLRLARMVRLLNQFKELWTLVQGFMGSLSTMTYTSIILFMVIYGFGCLGMELIRNNKAYGQDALFTEITDTYFCNLPRIMLTLAQFIAMDSVAAIYTPLIIQDAYLALYFFGVILAVAVVLMNIVTAVIVNTALETNEIDKESKRAYQSEIRKTITGSLRQMFDFFDEKNIGHVTLDQLLNAPEEACNLLCQLTEHDTMEDLFREIDLDNNNELTLEEFCGGVYDITTSEVPREIRHMQKNFWRIMEALTRIEEKFDEKLDQAMMSIQSADTKHNGSDGTSRQHTREDGRGDTSSLPRQLKGEKDEKLCSEGATAPETAWLPVLAPPWALSLLSELADWRAGILAGDGLASTCVAFHSSDIMSVTADTGSAPNDYISRDTAAEGRNANVDGPVAAPAYRSPTNSEIACTKPSLKDSGAFPKNGTADLRSLDVRDVDSRSEGINGERSADVQVESIPLTSLNSDAAFEEQKAVKRKGKVTRKKARNSMGQATNVLQPPELFDDAVSGTGNSPRIGSLVSPNIIGFDALLEDRNSDFETA